MHADVRFPRAQAFDSDYWLHRCEGFRVDSPAGRLGWVDDVRFLSRVDRPDALAVRTGFLGRRLVIVPIEDVAHCIPAEGRIVLRRVPRGRSR